MTYEKFEHQAISKLLEGNDPIFERLFEQFLEAEVLRREETDIGFVVDFEVSKSLSIGDVTKQIAAVSVMLAEEEVLLLELSVSEGIVTQLNGTYTSRFNYSEIVPKFNDLIFLYVPSSAAATKPAEVMAKPVKAVAKPAKITAKLSESVVKSAEIAMELAPIEAPTQFTETESSTEVVKRNKIFSSFRNDKKTKPEEVELTQDSRLIEQAKHLSIQNIQPKNY